VVSGSTSSAAFLFSAEGDAWESRHALCTRALR